jgi:hypothetical protein
MTSQPRKVILCVEDYDSRPAWMFEELGLPRTASAVSA